MQLPNPTDAFLNPVRYWSDVYAMQVELARTSLDLALTFNPMLPEGEFAPFWTSLPASGSVRSPSDPGKKSAGAHQASSGQQTQKSRRAPKRRAVTLPPEPSAPSK